MYAVVFVYTVKFSCYQTKSAMDIR